MRKKQTKRSICIISSYISGFGKTGGYGNMTKKLAISLRRRGCEVTVVVPRRPRQPRVSFIEGVKVIGLSPWQFFQTDTYKKIDADIYHSQNPNFLSFIAMKAQVNKKHIVTCRDPMDLADWVTEFRFATWGRRLRTPFVFLFESGPFVSYAVRNADLVGCPAFFLIKKIRKMYRRPDAVLLPNIESFTKERIDKSKKATVCFVGRLDVRKRPEIVFDLARKFSHVDFLVVGKAQDARRQSSLLTQARKYRNIKMLGNIDKFKSNRLSGIYEASWILLNASPREGLPLTFIEAAGRGCAILSRVNPDGFASKFGYWVRDGDFSKGLTALLERDNWRAKGRLGQQYVRDVYDETKAVNTHLRLYEELLRMA